MRHSNFLMILGTVSGGLQQAMRRSVSNNQYRER